MGAVSYTIKTFNPEEAASGALCIVLNYTQYNNIGNNANVVGVTINPDATYIDDQSHEVSLIVGTGICKRRGDLFTITINSTNYTFNIDGTGYSGTARGKYIYRCEVNDSTVTRMNSATVAGKFTRGDDGSWEYTPGGSSTILLDSLTVRDEFAAQALRGILARIDNPSVLSEDEIKFYCDAAYKWAESMLKEAAKTRAGVVGGSSDTTRGYTDGSEAILAEIADAISNISISGGGGSADTSGLVAVLNKMLYTISSEGRWHYHTAIINDSGQFKFVYRPIYGRAQVKLEYYDSNGNLLPESTVTNWLGKRYTASNDEIDDGGNLIKTYSQLIDMIMTDSAVADSEGYYYKAIPQYPSGSNVTVASVKVFVDVNSIKISGGGSGESATDVSGIEDALEDLTSAVKDGDYPSLAASLAIMTDLGQGVPLRNYTDTNNAEVPLQVSGKFAGAISNERVTPQGGGNPRKDPFLVQLDDNSLGSETGHEIYTKNSVSFEANQGIKVSEQVTSRTVKGGGGTDAAAYVNTYERNEDRTVSFASGASVGVSGTLALENAEDSNNDPKPIIVESVIKNSPSESDPTINVPLEVDSIPWTMLGEYSASNGEITIPNILSSFEYVKVIPYNNGTAFSSEYRCDVEWYDPVEEIDVYREGIVIGSLGYQKFPSNIDNLTVSLNSSYHDQTLTSLVIYVAGNASSVNVSGGGSGGGGSIDVGSDWTLIYDVVKNSSGYFKFEINNNGYGDVIGKIELYGENGLLPDDTVTDWNGGRYSIAGNAISGDTGCYQSELIQHILNLYGATDPGDYLLYKPRHITGVGDYSDISTVTRVKIYFKKKTASSSIGVSSLPALHIGSTSSSTARGESADNPFYISMPGYLTLNDVGVQNGKVLRLAELPVADVIKANSNYNQDYNRIDGNIDPDDYSNEAYFKGLVRWAITEYLGVYKSDNSNITLIGSARPNSTGTVHIDLYGDSGRNPNADDPTLPMYCSGMYLALNGVIFIFGTYGGAWYWRQINPGNLATKSQLSGYLALTGGTMENSIVTPGSDSYGIYPQTSGYGFVGSNTNWYYKMYGCQLNAETITLYSNNNGSRSVMGGIDSSNFYLYPGTGFWNFQVNSNGDIDAHKCNLSDSLQVIPFTYNNSTYYRVTATDSGGLNINERRLYIGNSYMQITNSGGGSVKQQADGATYKFEASPNSGGQSGVTSFLFNKDIITEGLYSIKYLSGAYTFNAKQWFTYDSAGMIYHFGCYDQNGYGMSTDMLYDFEGTVRANNISVSSDARLKNIVNRAEFEVDKLATLPLVRFTWKNDERRRMHFGSIAQEWQKVLPEVVSDNGDGMLAMDYGAAAMAAGVTACREIVVLKEENKELKKTVEYLKKELEAIKEIVYGKKENDMED